VASPPKAEHSGALFRNQEIPRQTLRVRPGGPVPRACHLPEVFNLDVAARVTDQRSALKCARDDRHDRSPHRFGRQAPADRQPDRPGHEHDPAQGHFCKCGRSPVARRDGLTVVHRRRSNHDRLGDCDCVECSAWRNSSVRCRIEYPVRCRIDNLAADRM